MLFDARPAPYGTLLGFGRAPSIFLAVHPECSLGVYFTAWQTRFIAYPEQCQEAATELPQRFRKAPVKPDKSGTRNIGLSFFITEIITVTDSIVLSDMVAVHICQNLEYPAGEPSITRPRFC